MDTEVDETGAARSPKRRRGKKAGRSRWRKLVSRYCSYIVVRCMYALVSRLPLGAGLMLSRVGGRLAYCVDRRYRRIAYDNLKRVYGDVWSERELRRRVREVFQHTAATVTEWTILSRWSNERLQTKYPEVVAQVKAFENEARARGDGYVGVTAHLGNWEVLSLFYDRFAPGILVPVAKRVYFKKYQDFVHRLRTAGGMDVIYTDESPRRLIRAIRGGKMPGFLPDQTVRTNSGIFVDFFDKPVYTSTLPVQLARKLDVKVFFTVLIREEGALLGARDHGYRLTPARFYEVPHTDDETNDLLVGTIQWTRLLEESIRGCPVQWSWIYHRWRASPGNPRLHHGMQSRMRSEGQDSLPGGAADRLSDQPAETAETEV